MAARASSSLASEVCQFGPGPQPPRRRSMAACLAAPRASLLPQAPGKQVQAAAALAPRASSRVLAARPQQRAAARRAMTVTAMAASELRSWQSHGLVSGLRGTRLQGLAS